MRKNRVVYRMSVMASLLAIGTFVFAGGGGNRDGSSLSKKKSPEVGTLEQLVQVLESGESDGDKSKALTVSEKVGKLSELFTDSPEAVSKAVAMILEGSLSESTQMAMVRAIAREVDAPEHLKKLAEQGKLPPPVKNEVMYALLSVDDSFSSFLSRFTFESEQEGQNSSLGGGINLESHPAQDEIEDLISSFVAYRLESESEFGHHYGNLSMLEKHWEWGNLLLSEMQELLNRYPFIPRLYIDEEGNSYAISESLSSLSSAEDFLKLEYWLLDQNSSMAMMNGWLPDWLARISAKIAAALGIDSALKVAKALMDAIDDIAEESGLLGRLKLRLICAGNSKLKKSKAIGTFLTDLLKTSMKGNGKLLRKALVKRGVKRAELSKIMKTIAWKCTPIVGWGWFVGSLLWACGHQLFCEEESVEISSVSAFPKE